MVYSGSQLVAGGPLGVRMLILGGPWLYCSTEVIFLFYFSEIIKHVMV
jgi:hypothetical protein